MTVIRSIEPSPIGLFGSAALLTSNQGRTAANATHFCANQAFLRSNGAVARRLGEWADASVSDGADAIQGFAKAVLGQAKQVLIGILAGRDALADIELDAIHAHPALGLVQ